VTEGVPKIKALEQAQRSSDQLVLSSRKSFQAGSRTVLDVLNAEQQRVFVLRDLAQARYVYLTSKVRLLSLVGGADLEAVQAINSYLQP
jgi:outer membrane protein TolC